jgi:hypothetical protein
MRIYTCLLCFMHMSAKRICTCLRSVYSHVCEAYIHMFAKRICTCLRSVYVYTCEEKYSERKSIHILYILYTTAILFYNNVAVFLLLPSNLKKRIITKTMKINKNDTVYLIGKLRKDVRLCISSELYRHTVVHHYGENKIFINLLKSKLPMIDI